MALGTAPGAARGAQIASLGHYLPEAVVSTEEVAGRLGIDPEWVVARTGIRERRQAAKDETVVDLATAAATHALAGLDADPRFSGAASLVDTVIVATSTPESTMPSVAARVAARTGLGHPAAFDLNAACAGFCHGLATADGLVRSGTSRGVLVIGADKATAWLDWDDRDTAILFGDGAGAAVVLPHDRRAIGPVVWGSVGEESHLISIGEEDRVLRQQGRTVYRWATGLGDTVARVCERAGVEPGGLAAFVPHQANLRIVNALAKHLGVAGDAVATDVVGSGNTIAATIPLALSRMRHRPNLANGGDVLLFGFGAGLSYAGQVVTLPPLPTACPVGGAAGTAWGEFRDVR
ncbi:beta-ketoacyl-ACP synthase 3 [Streptomyces millisiae]|uniref:Beta-ketoacyl-ACP synthase 3 n=1 Tax=Streptomyces millisiae TaxID=3075542 RepID=A0ABU2LHY1_9ACTN|nr:beta-ketoacyl-ACP synthase 3 [Streptomyces sp. DSM 44918]MDT0317183.1 beta-ketoacyl-ACP synthase 3 [Streptomyces sp. DSM 44918]